MLYPKKNKLKLKPFFSAKDFLIGKKISFKLPKTVILMPSAEMTKFLKGHIKKHYSLFSDIDIINDNVAVVHNFSVGAPLCVFIAEQLAELGVENFILIGVAGGIGKKLNLHQKVLCTGAFADEGTSRHYVTETLIKPSKELTEKLSYLAENKGYTWTIDAMFCETKQEVNFYEKQGAQTVEMEAAGVFAFAKKRGLKSGAIFVISDLLNSTKWDALPDRKKSAQTLAQLMFDIAKKFA
ncbi:MAG: nucleoside phosphorylase [Elusimicrobiaceae bacterium]|nr:nucleoside phosphorylase [Elusimicrobiaceae bacterium]